MPLDRAMLTELALQSLTAPRQAFRRVLDSGGGYGLALPALGLVAVLSAVLSALLSRISAPLGDPAMDAMLAQPIRLALMQLAGMALVAVAVTGIGRMFGGRGRLDQAILVVAWFEFVLIALQLALILIMLALPALGGVLLVAVALLVLWLFANAVAELHGFKSAFATLSVVLGVVLLIAVALTLFLPPLQG